MSDQPKSLLDLVPSGPTKSEPFDLKGKQVFFRLLDSMETIACRTAAVRQASARIAEELDVSRVEAVSLLDSGLLSDNQTELYELYILAASLSDCSDGGPVAMGDQDEVMRYLADTLTPMDRLYYRDKYLQFADDNDPATITDDQLEELVTTGLGKLQDTSYLRQSGSNVLRSCVRTMAYELATLRLEIVALREQDETPALTTAEVLQIRRFLDGGGSLSDSDASAETFADRLDSPSD